MIDRWLSTTPILNLMTKIRNNEELSTTRPGRPKATIINGYGRITVRWLRTSYGKKIRTLRDILGGRLVSCLESCLSYRRLFQGLAQLFLDSLSWIKSNGILSEPDRALVLDRMLRSLERDGHHAHLWVAPE